MECRFGESEKEKGRLLRTPELFHRKILERHSLKVIGIFSKCLNQMH